MNFFTKIKIKYFTTTHKKIQIASKITDNDNMSSMILTLLSKEQSCGVRVAVGKNNNTPLEVLKNLAYDKYYDVRLAVFNNDLYQEYITSTSD